MSVLILCSFNKGYNASDFASHIAFFTIPLDNVHYTFAVMRTLRYPQWSFIVILTFRLAATSKMRCSFLYLKRVVVDHYSRSPFTKEIMPLFTVTKL